MLSDKDIEKRMVEALDEGGRHTVDELVKSTGIDEKRIWKALQALETEELCAHITLEGTPRWYGTVPHVKDDPPPKKVRMYHSPPKVPCPKCKGMYGPTGLAKHIKSCKGPITTCPISQLPKGAKLACPICGDLFDPRGLGPHKRACKGKSGKTHIGTAHIEASPLVPDGFLANRTKAIEDMVEAVDKVIDRETGAISTAHITVTPAADYTITAGPLTPIDNLPVVALEDKRSDGERLQDLGDLIGTRHWDGFLGAEKRHEYINGFQHGFKHGYEHRIKEEEDGRNKA